MNFREALRALGGLKIAVLVLAFIAIVAAVGYRQGQVAEEEQVKQNFLTPSRMVQSELQRDTYILRDHGRGATLVTGEAVKKWLLDADATWKSVKVAPSIKSEPSFTLYLNPNQGYELKLYKDEANLVAVFYKDLVQYYKVPEGTYEKLSFLHAVQNYAVPEEVVEAVLDGKMTTLQSVNETPTNRVYKVLKIGREGYYLYEHKGKYYCESPYQSIRELSKEVYQGALPFTEAPESIVKSEFSKATVDLVEEALKEIMSSPQTSSNPEDYIKAHQKSFDKILEQGGDEALAYMQSELDHGQATGLRGEILKRLCLAKLKS